MSYSNITPEVRKQIEEFRKKTGGNAKTKLSKFEDRYSFLEQHFDDLINFRKKINKLYILTYEKDSLSDEEISEGYKILSE